MDMDFYNAMREINRNLDKIVELLEFRNSISQARNELKDGIYVECNCDIHKPGESTGGWLCPVHGQQI